MFSLPIKPTDHTVVILIKLLFLSSILLTLFINLQIIDCTRAKLYSSDEPTEKDVYRDYGAFFTDKSYYYLKSAGLLKKSDIHSEDLSNFNGSTSNLKFNSNDFLRRLQKIAWLLPGTDRISLHVYDDPKEMNLASGPQVNQQICGLLLDYMNYMADKHYKHLTNTTELSIFYILNSYGSPTVGLTAGSTVFPGDYQTCVEAKLNIIKRELNKINRRESGLLFEEKQHNNKIISNKQSVNNNKMVKFFENFFKTIKYYFLYLFDLYEGDESNYSIIEKYQDKIKTMPTRYCMAGLRWPTWSNSSFDKRTLAIRVGTCLPDVCDSNSVKFYHNKIKRLTERQIPEYYRGYYIGNLYCLPDENSPLRNPFNYTSAMLFIAFTSIWALSILISTLFGSLIEKKFSNCWYFLNSWCFTKNLSNFLEKVDSNSSTTASINNQKMNDDRESIEKNKKLGNSIDLKPLNGFKVLSSFAVVTSHVLILAFGVSWNGLSGHRLLSKSLLAAVSSIGPSSVDNFFVVTGLISAYSLLQKPHDTLMKPIFWIQFLIYRYIRVVPLYLIVHWGIQSSGRFLGSGPFWDYATSYTAWGKRCENDSLFGVIIPMANLKSPTDQCNPVGWYLANDIQFSLITPFIIILYLKNTFIANLTVLITTFLVMINHIKFYYYEQIESRSGLEFSMFTMANITVHGAPGYTKPQYRCLSYFIGLMAGHLLYQYEKGLIKKWPNYFIDFCKILVCFTMATLSFIPYLTLLLPVKNLSLMHLLGSIFAGTIHGLTSFGAAALLLLVCTGQFKTLSQLLSLNIFEPLAKASLCTALIHSPIIFYHIHSFHSLPEISLYYMLSMNVIWIIESIIASVALHILVELPLRKFLIKALIKMLSGGKDRNESSKTVEQQRENRNGSFKQADSPLKEKLN